MFPSENDFIARNDFSVLALDRYLSALAVDDVPTELPAHSRFSDELACPDPNRAKPFFQLSRIGPCAYTRVRGAFMNRVISSDVSSSVFVVTFMFSVFVQRTV